VKLPRADGSGPFLLRLTRPTTSRRRHLRRAAVSPEPCRRQVRHWLLGSSGIPARQPARFQTLGM